jgi:N-acetylglutamate synthase-like GNAT family acetyltransferase
LIEIYSRPHDEGTGIVLFHTFASDLISQWNSFFRLDFLALFCIALPLTLDFSSMDDVEIRHFVQSDQDEVAEVYSAGRDSHIDVPVCGRQYVWAVTQRLKPDGDMRNIQEMYVDKIPGKNCFLVAVVNGKIVGCVAGMPASKYCTVDCVPVELLRMSVLTEYRRFSIATKLLQTLTKWAKNAGYSKMYLSTLSGFIGANIFYPKNGFKLVDTEDVDVTQRLQSDEQEFITWNYYIKDI